MSHSLFFIVMSVALLPACKSPESPTPPVVQPPVVITPPVSVTVPAMSGPRKLVWQDEFDKPGLPDPTRWAYDVGGHGWGNNEAQYYTSQRSENARVEKGKLIIEARKESFEGKNYTSARLLTQNKIAWTYGRFEIMAKLPQGRGTWPALWMLGENITTVSWPLCGEIDIMEHVGFDEGVVHGTIHSEAYNHSKNTQKGGQTTQKDVTSQFHLYAMEWTADQIDFFLDDRKYYTVQRSVLGSSPAQWPFGNPFFLIMNVAVGGNWGGAQGIDERIWPQRMEVDYVRVYQ